MGLHPIVKQEIAKARAWARTKAEQASLRRLGTKQCAIEAWEALQAKDITEGQFRWIAFEICGVAAQSRLKESERKTKSEIVDAADEAKRLAIALADHIDRNDTLHFSGEDLQFPKERVALDRLFRGLSFTEGKFHPLVEAEVDKLQARDYPAHKSMTTGEAVRLLSYPYGDSPWIFAWRLRRFAELAHASRSARPVTPHPNAALAAEKLFAIRVAAEINDAVGSPCHSLVAKFTTAVFNGATIPAETIKKWWQRRGDKFTR